MEDQQGNPSTILTVRLTREEMEEVDSLRDMLQDRAKRGVTITRKTVVLEAMDLLSAYMEKLNRDKQRDR